MFNFNPLAPVKLALNYLNRATDPDRGFEPFLEGKLSGNPPCLCHHSYDTGDATARFIIAFIRARQMLGSLEISPAEAAMRANIVKYLRPDGLTWKVDAPWSYPVAHLWDQGRNLRAFIDLYIEDKNPAWLERFRAMAKALENIADRQGNDLVYPASSGWDGKTWLQKVPRGLDWKAPLGGQLIEPFARFAEATGEEIYLDLARRVADGFLDGTRFIQPDGSFQGHFHNIAGICVGLCMLSRLGRWPRYREAAQRTWDWIFRSGSAGSFGFGVEVVGRDCAHCETCCITDLIQWALESARAGRPEGYDDAERFARNHLVEAQFRPDHAGLVKQGDKIPPDTDGIKYANAADRMIGGFAGHVMPNDFSEADHQRLPPIWGCCSPAGVIGFYYAWDAAVVNETGRLTVNLWIDRAFPGGRVACFEPKEGLLMIELDHPGRQQVIIRKRAGVDWQGASALTGSGQNSLREEPLGNVFEEKDGYLHAKAGMHSRVGLRYKPSRTTSSYLNPGYRNNENEQYTVHWTGHTVIGMDPAGVLAPLYKGRYKAHANHTAD